MFTDFVISSRQERAEMAAELQNMYHTLLREELEAWEALKGSNALNKQMAYAEAIGKVAAIQGVLDILTGYPF